MNARDFVEAEALCHRVLKRAPRNPEALRVLGTLRLVTGRAADAIPLLREALRADERNIEALDALGSALLVVKEYLQAEEVMQLLIAVGGESPLWNMRLGVALASQGRLIEAVSHLEEAVRSAPDFVDARHNLGNAFMALNRTQEALECFERVLALEPQHVEARNALATALQEAGRMDQAISAYRRALQLDPQHAMAHQNLGNALWEQGSLEEAAQCLTRAVALKPDYVRAWSSLGAVRLEQGRSEEGLAALRQALSIDPNSAEPKYNLALARLYEQAFEEAWPLYEERVRCEVEGRRLRKDPVSLERCLSLPRWRGPVEEPGRTVAVWNEQGIGDQLLYSTLIPELIATGTDFVYEVDRRLLPAYERSFPGCRFVPLSDPPHPALEENDRVLLAGSLPGLFRRDTASFARQPAQLLKTDPIRVEHFRRSLAELGRGLKVALSWRSSRADRAGPEKSAPLSAFEPLLAQSGALFVDVQYGDTAAERNEVEAASGARILHFDEVDLFNDLDELLAILEACDLLISTSSATAHLGGALGKRVWLIHRGSRPPFHYWTRAQSGRSLWYPSVEIVAGAEFRDWDSLIRHTAAKLTSWTQGPVAH